MDADYFFYSLSSPYRRDILRLLQNGGCSAGEIAGRLPISQPSVSRHLDILKHCGLLEARRHANQIIYSLSPSAMKEAAAFLDFLSPQKPAG